MITYPLDSSSWIHEAMHVEKEYSAIVLELCYSRNLCRHMKEEWGGNTPPGVIKLDPWRKEFD